MDKYFESIRKELDELVKGKRESSSMLDGLVTNEDTVNRYNNGRYAYS